MSNTIRLKRGTTVPTAGSLVTGELAINTVTGAVYTKTDSATVVQVGGGGVWGSITGTLSSQTDLNTALGLKAPLESPALTGTPTTPTATTGDSTTTISSTAFVQQELAAGTAQSKNVISTVRNQTGATLSKGTVVYITGASGNKATVSKAQANAESTSSQTYAVLLADIATNNNGLACVIGTLEQIDTSAFTAGQQLYLSPTTAGEFTATKPSAPNHIVYIGVVTRVHANQGTIELRIQNGYELGELHNVAISTPTDGDLIAYEGSTSLYKNKSLATMGIATQSWVNSQSYATTSSVNTSLASYVLGTTLTSTLTNYVTDSFLTAQNYATQSFVTGQGYLTDAPTNGNFYLRYNGAWQQIGSSSDTIATQVWVQAQGYTTSGWQEAPNDGYQYARQNNTWTLVTGGGGGIGDAPSDGNVYGRQSGNWTVVTNGLADAPSNGSLYARQNGGWVSFTQGSTTVASGNITTSVQNLYSTSYYVAVGDTNTVLNLNGVCYIYLGTDCDVGTQLVFLQSDMNNSVFTGTNGATVYANNSRFRSNGAYAVVTAIKRDTYTWFLAGDIIQ